MGTSAGKRQREREKLDKARDKAERKAVRLATNPESPDTSSLRSESELIEDLGAIHRAFEAGDLPLEDFEERRDLLQSELAQVAQ
jgi:hypothetical protein